ncbi:MAG: hypothetical protein JWO36_6274 [Myxococcales bacterium]|nr:hypothetical protein [Myxococcales bacterium]
MKSLIHVATWMLIAAASSVASADSTQGAVLVGQAPTPSGVAASVLYLNRCTGGCTIHGTGGVNEATSHTSSLPCNGGATCGGGGCFCMNTLPADYTVREFVAADGVSTGSAADAEWNAIVKCMQEVYSPYAVTITDQKPNGVTYNEAIIAGRAMDIGYSNNQVGGIATVPSDCSSQNNVISFSFANGVLNGGRVLTICAIAAQETAHSYGLNHEYEFLDFTSACKDPMSYRGDCGGQKFFRNEPARCGEFAPRACNCGGTQNSHLKLLDALGPGTPITRPPHVEVVSPASGAAIANGSSVVVTAGAQRGVEKVELWLNNYLWLTRDGAAFGPSGQPDPSSYALVLPATVPNGVIDIVVKAYDDLLIKTETAPVTVTKGAPCVTAATDCATGQKCDAGKCFWDPPTGMLGDACTYPQFCTSGICQGTVDTQICTQACLAGVADTCPMGFDCIMTDGTNGICLPAAAATAGCCSVSRPSEAVWVHAVLSVLVVGLLIRRRRK